jgi:hypothetical protein
MKELQIKDVQHVLGVDFLKFKDPVNTAPI